jgi:ribosomal protein S18 acetylase RimI-like enzyme
MAAADITVVQAACAGGAVREKISALFVEAFEKDLRFFSRDTVQLARACAHMFALEYFYVALVHDELAGMAACVDIEHFCIRPDRAVLIQHLGLFKGISAYLVFKYYFNKYPKYDTPLDAQTASLEFVAVAEKYRKQGVATALLRHLVTVPEYDSYMLEVADTNTAACALYAKIGFRELFRKPLRLGKKYAGIDALIYMRYGRAGREGNIRD